MAPTMPDRFSREAPIIGQVLQWMEDDVDIIALQEMNDFTIGLIGSIYYNYYLHIYFCIWIQRFLEICFIIEGYIFPFFHYNNSYWLNHVIDFENDLRTESNYLFIKKMPNYHLIKSKPSSRGLNTGLVIITKHKIESYSDVNHPTDFIHKPGSLYANLNYNGENILFVNSHLIPRLPNYTYLYKIVNAVNKCLMYDTKKLQKKNIDTFKHIFRDKYDSIYMVGDFNIKKKIEPTMYKRLVKQIDLIESTDILEEKYICTQHHIGCSDGEKDHEIDQIDYIFSNNNAIKCYRLETAMYLSDHYPIYAKY
jgi:endonuclease/exonuclease/phosphatase family metal-dependent hydrolase